jgi:hypothetical protein
MIVSASNAAWCHNPEDCNLKRSVYLLSIPDDSTVSRYIADYDIDEPDRNTHYVARRRSICILSTINTVIKYDKENSFGSKYISVPSSNIRS